MHRPCDHVTDESRDGAEGRLPHPAIGFWVHLREESDGDARADDAAYCRDTGMIHAKRECQIAAGHDQKASKPGGAELFCARTDERVSS